MSVKIHQLERGYVFTIPGLDDPNKEFVFRKMDGAYAQVNLLVGYNPRRYDTLLWCGTDVNVIGHITDPEYFEKTQQPSEADVIDMAKHAKEDE